MYSAVVCERDKNNFLERSYDGKGVLYCIAE